MNWIRYDLFTPLNLGKREISNTTKARMSNSTFYQKETDTESCPLPRVRCPVHKHIRDHSWSTVKSIIRNDASQISLKNRVGWSSLILAVYHSAPVEVIAEMLALVSEKKRILLLSTPVPNGNRLCLHFAARFADNLEVVKLLTEPYPLALILLSTDGNRPLDRAMYYGKDNSILHYLETATKQEELRVDNQKLRHVIILCCQKFYNENTQDKKESSIHFIVELYRYSREREMIGLFWNVLSYVGIPRRRRSSPL